MHQEVETRLPWDRSLQMLRVKTAWLSLTQSDTSCLTLSPCTSREAVGIGMEHTFTYKLPVPSLFLFHLTQKMMMAEIRGLPLSDMIVSL